MSVLMLDLYEIDCLYQEKGENKSDLHLLDELKLAVDTIHRSQPETKTLGHRPQTALQSIWP